MNTGIKNLTSRKMEMLAAGVGALVLMTGIMSAGIIPTQQVAAQMPGNQTGNATGGTQTATTAGKLKALDLASEILAMKVKIKMAQAIQTATEELGPDAHIVKAELTTSGDDVVYKVIGLKEGRIYVVTIDPVDGNRLDSKNFSLRELIEMHMRGEDHMGMDAMMMPSMGR
jgi:hypothetical protein